MVFFLGAVLESSPGTEIVVGSPPESILVFDSCTVTNSQLQEIVNSLEHPEKCILTVPSVLSGPLDRLAHVVACFPDSVPVKDAFVLLPSDLLVPFDCYKHIASLFAGGSQLFQEDSGLVLSDGQLVDSKTVASVVACLDSPASVLILTQNNLVVPYNVYKTYLNRILTKENSTLKVVLPGLNVPIPYPVFQEIYEKYIGASLTNGHTNDKKLVKLFGSKTKLTFEQFVAVINNRNSIKKATVTLPSKKCLSLASFMTIINVLGDEYANSCLISIPNTPHTLPFPVVREIFELYLPTNPSCQF